MSRSGPPDHTSPFPYFKLFMLFWHVFYLGGLAGLLITILVQDRGAWGTRHLLIAACLAAQAALYARYVMRMQTWPMAGRQMVVYFGGTLLLWLVEWQLDARLSWLGMMTIGQMFGILRPWAAIPGASAVAFYFLARVNNWQIGRISLPEVIGWAASVVLFVYLYELFRTNMERANLIAELKEAQRKLEESRRNEIELAALRERERLAREMHDGLGHVLVAISVQLEAVQRLYRVDPEQASARVDELKSLARASMDELRHALAGLRAPGLGERALEPALQELCVAFGQRSQIETSLRVSGSLNHLPPSVTEMAWRVVQEALTNVEKHAQARRVQVELAVTPRLLDLTVCDDGIGLHAGQPVHGNGHYGLMGLAERVEGLGGTFHAQPGESGGTCVRVQVPLSGAVQEG